MSENHDSFLRLLKNNDFKEEKITKVGLYAISTSTTLESNKSPGWVCYMPAGLPVWPAGSPPCHGDRVDADGGIIDHGGPRSRGRPVRQS